MLVIEDTKMLSNCSLNILVETLISIQKIIMVGLHLNWLARIDAKVLSNSFCRMQGLKVSTYPKIFQDALILSETSLKITTKTMLDS